MPSRKKIHKGSKTFKQFMKETAKESAAATAAFDKIMCLNERGSPLEKYRKWIDIYFFLFANNYLLVIFHHSDKSSDNMQLCICLFWYFWWCGCRININLM